MTPDSFPDPFPTDDARRARAERTVWTTLGRLYRWRRFIAGVTGTAAVLAVVLSLLMQNWYVAQTRLLLPPRTGTGLLSAAVMSNLPTAARSLLGGGGGDYFRYLSILSSRSMQEAVIDSFDLVRVYEVEDSETPRQDAIDILADNVELLIDDEYEFLTVSVADHDPERAARMANFLVRKLSAMNSALASQSARQFREYVEQRYDESEASLDSVLTALRMFQERYGVLQLEQQ
ncbi:MAG: lipopolysaccharide biosynthesis protein, partial [Rhodothermales bacterium]|nr:lipopolysaccharide biosynthesis protein [Rhodothermales bacterium]